MDAQTSPKASCPSGGARSLLILVGTLALSSCAHFSVRTNDADDLRFVNYDSTALCRGVDGNLSLEEPVDRQVHRIACNTRLRGDLHERIYAAYRPAEIDHFTAALMITSCVASGRCLSDRHRPPGLLSQSYSASGQLYRWAVDLDLAQVRGVLDEIELDPRLESLFLTRVNACREEIIQVVDGWNPRLRRVYAVVPHEVLSRRDSEELALAAQYAQFAALRPALEAAILDSAPADLLRGQARALRAAYVQACVEKGRPLRYCVTGPIARPLTRYLLRLAVQADDPIAALVEYSLLSAGPDLSDPRYEVHVAVGGAIAKETSDHQRYTAALEDGFDARLVAERFGDPPPVNLYNRLNAAGLRPPDDVPHGREVRQMRRRLVYVRGVVSQIQRTDASVTAALDPAEVCSHGRGFERDPRSDGLAL
ncbi:MAG: hypothetical protein AAGF12_22710, partial [Myxococcota bacterium]